MKKLVIYLLVAGIILCLAVVIGYKYLHRDSIPAVEIPQSENQPVAEQLQGPAAKTNPRIELITETAQSVNVDSYMSEQARLRDFFQSVGTAAVQGEPAATLGK